MPLNFWLLLGVCRYENRCLVSLQEFAAPANTVLCGVFDGHGPRGHLVARHVRDSLPLLLALPSKVHVLPVVDGWNENIIAVKEDDGKESLSIISIEPEFPVDWKEKLVAAYKIMDQNLKTHPKINSFNSGSTAITMVLQDKDLVIANVGDSRAVLARRAGDGSFISDQLTVDLKPDLPGELERIRNCKGRVFALEDEPKVARVWRPHEDMPGLAMARAFGDFCLKEYGLIAVPEVSYRKLTEDDEFIILATDGVWDILSNDEVVGIVSSAFPKETAAERVVEAAVKKSKRNHAGGGMDDCAVVCYFLKEKLTPSAKTTEGVMSKSKAQASDRVVMDIDYASLTMPFSIATLHVEICPQQIVVAAT